MTPLVFALPGNEIVAKNIAKAIHAEIGKTIIRHFPDGETYVRVISNVKNRKTILVCTLNYPDEKLLPLYFLSKTLTSLGATSVCLVAPYLSYMRQDKVFKSGEGITSAYFASLLSEFADTLITIDPHLHRRHSMNEIYSIPCEVIHASILISKYIRKHVNKPLLIGPDSESEQWVSEVAKNAKSPFIILHKTRRSDSDVKISIPHVEKYSHHTPVLIDDIISTAQTMIETVKLIKNAKMKSPICIGVHAIFAGKAFENLKKAGAGKIVTCNSIPHITNEIDMTTIISKSIKEILVLRHF